MDADVIVIGAGAAGLAAARRLSARRLRVSVIEARDRIGGRVLWTDGSDGREIVELGAEFIHGRAPETMALLRRSGGSAVEIDGDSWTFSGDSVLKRDADDFRSATDIFEGVRDLTADESVDRYLRRFESDPTAAARIPLARAFVEGFDAADPAIAGVFGIADELRSGVDYATHRPSQGYGPLFGRLRDECVAAGVALEFSAVVRRVVWRAGEVVVVANVGGAMREFVGKAAVVTLPVGVLRAAEERSRVDFDPQLPLRSRDAFENIEMGHVTKVALRFRSPFWELVEGGRCEGASFFRCPSGDFPAYWTQRPLPGASIIAWAGGTKAIRLNGLPSDELVERAFAGFARLFGDAAFARSALIDGVVHDWSTDPFAQGAYSYLVVGGSGARAALGAPVEKTLFFAGEATSTDGQGGTVNGAIASGERAAREVVEAFRMEGR